MNMGFKEIEKREGGSVEVLRRHADGHNLNLGAFAYQSNASAKICIFQADVRIGV